MGVNKSFSEVSDRTRFTSDATRIEGQSQTNNASENEANEKDDSTDNVEKGSVPKLKHQRKLERNTPNVLLLKFGLVLKKTRKPREKYTQHGVRRALRGPIDPPHRLQHVWSFPVSLCTCRPLAARTSMGSG